MHYAYQMDRTQFAESSVSPSGFFSVNREGRTAKHQKIKPACVLRQAEENGRGKEVADHCPNRGPSADGEKVKRTQPEGELCWGVPRLLSHR